MMKKDIQLALELGEELGVALRTAELVDDMLDKASSWAGAMRILLCSSGSWNISQLNVRRQMSDVSIKESKEGSSASNVDREQWLHMYEQMFKIRAFEEQVNELYQSAKMPGLAHLYIGEEAIAVGVCEALKREDYITSTHRGHGHCLAKGASVDRMFCELLGKEPGYCRGKGGSMHIADQETGNLGANAIVGGSSAIATGAAFASKRLGNGRVAVCFFGEGALGQGLVYESMNMAQLWKLPVIYVCENNLIQRIHSSLRIHSRKYESPRRGIWNLTVEVDGQNVREVHEAARRLVERARSGEGPAFMLCNTYRYLGHHVGDISREYYRPKKKN